MRFIVTVEDDRRKNINEVAGAIKGLGAKVESVLKMTGIIIGVTKRNLSDLKIDGVKSVEPEREVMAKAI